MSKKTPTGITLLMIFFILGILNKVSGVVSSKIGIGAMIWDRAGLLWLLGILGWVFLGLNVAALYVLLGRKKWGVKFLYGYFGLNILMIIVGLSLVLLDFEFFRESYLQSRIDRGMSMSEEWAKIITPLLGILTMSGGVLFYAYLGYYVFKKRGYFVK